MKVVIFGASGTIGRAIIDKCPNDFELIKVGRRSGDVQADYTDEDSIKQMYEKIGSFDALCCVAGRDSQFVEFGKLKVSDFQYGFERKLMGQIRLVLEGLNHINKGGSFTLSSGFLSAYPNPYSMATSPLNAFVDNFAESMSNFLPNDVRINVVSPAPVAEIAESRRVTAKMVAEGFIESMTGKLNGHVFKIWNIREK